MSTGRKGTTVSTVRDVTRKQIELAAIPLVRRRRGRRRARPPGVFRVMLQKFRDLATGKRQGVTMVTDLAFPAMPRHAMVFIVARVVGFGLHIARSRGDLVSQIRAQLLRGRDIRSGASSIRLHQHRGESVNESRHTRLLHVGISAACDRLGNLVSGRGEEPLSDSDEQGRGRNHEDEPEPCPGRACFHIFG